MAYKEQKIAVIGAGIAGLSAAYRLKQLGFSNVEVFEARERVGGRIYTVILENNGKEFPVELGGWNLTDGGVKCYVDKMIKEFGLSTQEINLRVSKNYFDGISKYDLSEYFKNYVNKIGEANLESYIQTRAEKHNTIDELLRDLFAEDEVIYKNCYLKYAGFEGGLPEDISAKHWKNIPYILHGGIASMHSTNEVELSFIKGGNAKLTERLAEELQSQIRINHVLKSLSESGDLMKLEFGNGEVVACDKVILAMPLSVLSDIDADVIPSERLDLLKKVKYGTTGKIVWNEDVDRLENLICDEFAVLQMHKNEPITLYCLGGSGKELRNNADVLLKQAVAYISPEFENIQYALVEATEQQFRKYNESVFHSWCEDPFSKGSYSFRNVEVYDAINEIEYYSGIAMRKPYLPIDGKIYFAGEHTAVDADIGTIEGAAESGYRVAELIASIV